MYRARFFHRLQVSGFGLVFDQLRVGFSSGKQYAIFGIVSAASIFLALSAMADEVRTPFFSDIHQTFEKSRKAIVRIEAEDQFGRISGTGFFFTPTGMILTSYSVAGISPNVIVEYENQRYSAERLIADDRSGIVVLKVNATTPFLPFGVSDDLQIASPVVLVGYPSDHEASVNFGIIGGFDLKYLDSYFQTRFIRANLLAQPGEQGAPLLGLDGKARGILMFAVDNRTVSYALPIKAAQKVIDDYMRYGEQRPGWVGFTAHQADARGEPQAVVDGVVGDSPAARAGLQVGDVILKFGATDIHSPADILDPSFFLSAGDEVPLKVLRGGKVLAIGMRAEMFPAEIPRIVAFPLETPKYQLPDTVAGN